MRRPVIAALAFTLLAGTPSLAAEDGVAAPRPPKGYGLFLNILPPGQGTSTTTADAVRFFGSGQRPPHDDDQVAMYANLIKDGNITGRDLSSLFKPEAFPVKNPERVEELKLGLKILRDSFGVPHIHGTTRANTVFGVGYATAEDRMFMIDVLRHLGAGRLSEFLGPSPANIKMDRDVYMVAGYTDEERQQQIDRLSRFGRPGRQVIRDVDNFVAGINARIDEVKADPSLMPAEYPALQIQPTHWQPSDVVAVATLIQAIFAGGGGGELRNAMFIEKAERKLGNRRALGLFRDLRQEEDPSAPVTADSRFPSQRFGKVNPRALAMPDPGTVEIYDPISTQPPSSFPTNGPASSDPRQTLLRDLIHIGLAMPTAMSNWIAVTGRHTASGHPIAVMGPQTAYFSPEILMEVDIHGPGIDARGATFPGLGYVLLGRGIDFAWSATSGESDLTDVRAERLCRRGGRPAGINSVHYLFRAKCVRMDVRTDTWVAKPTAGGQGEPKRVTARVERTRHGPVIARGEVDGKPVAFVSQRSSFFGELDSAPAFVLLNNNRVIDARSFERAVSYVTGSFNWLYVDDRHVAYFHSGKYPLRAPGVDPNLPSWGTGSWEWQGFMRPARHPQAIDPQKGWIASWNNKPARGWHTADDHWYSGPVDRVQMLTSRLGSRVRKGAVRPADMVQVMARAATVDLRGQEVLPSVLRLMGSPPGVSRYLKILRHWVATGAHRIDRDGDGQYENQAAVALMDAWWPRLIQGIFRRYLKGLYRSIQPAFDDLNREDHLGSAFQGGYYSYVRKAVDMALGRRVPDRYEVLRCGTGRRASCRAALRRSLEKTVDALGKDPSKWDADEQGDEIRFTAVGLITIPAIPWQNRPTFQQVVSVFRHRPR